MSILLQYATSTVARVVTEQDIHSLFADRALTPPELNYLNGQARRLAFVMNYLNNAREAKPFARVLDVGPHFLTRCLRHYIPDISVSTLGYAYPQLAGEGEHVHFDLIDTARGKTPGFQFAEFDLIVFCETIEHIYVSPLLILGMFNRLLSRKGGRVFVQTPNAVSLAKRLKMLSGKNPFEPLKETLDYRGHIREYTMKELEDMGKSVGWSVADKVYGNYWDHLFPANPIQKALEKRVPGFREGLTILFDAPSQS